MQTQTILIADDDAPIRNLVAQVLVSRGYRVLIAPDGEQALHLAGSNTGAIDLLITDLVMPGMQGAELADCLRAARPEMRVVLMSGYNEGEAVRGVDAFLAKPFRVETLLDIVHRTLPATSLSMAS